MSVFRRPKPGSAVTNGKNSPGAQHLPTTGWEFAGYTVRELFRLLRAVFSGKTITVALTLILAAWIWSQYLLDPADRKPLEIIALLEAFASAARTSLFAVGGWTVAGVAILAFATYAIAAEARLKKLGARAADKRDEQDGLRVRAADPPDPEAYEEELRGRFELADVDGSTNQTPELEHDDDD